MNYLTVIDRCSKAEDPKYLLFSGCDQDFRNHVLRHLIQTAAFNKKSLVILDNGNLLNPSDLEAEGYRVRNGLSGEFALCDPFCIDTLPDIIRLRTLLDSLGYSEIQKQGLVQYLNYLAHVENLDRPDGAGRLSLEIFGKYSTVAQMEVRLQQLQDNYVISPEEHTHLLAKYSELSADAADFEKMLYLLIAFVRGEPLALDTEGLAVVYPLKGLDEDAVFCSLLTSLLSSGLSTCRKERISVVILDRGFGERDYLPGFLGRLQDVEHHLLSEDIFTLCTGTQLTSLKNMFTAKVYSRHADMESCGAIEKSLGNIQIVKQSKAVQHDLRWRANSPWDVLLGNNKTEIKTTNAPVWEPRYPKETVHSLNLGSAILEINGSSTIVTV